MTSLITLPARLGYEVARRTIDVAYGVGRAVGVFGGGDDAPPAATASESAAPRAEPRTAAQPKPARTRSARPKAAPKPKPARRRPPAKRAAAQRTAARRPAAEPAAAQPDPGAVGGASAEPAPKAAPAAQPAAPAESAAPQSAAPAESAAAPEPAAPAESAAAPEPGSARAPGAVPSDDVSLIEKVETVVLGDTDTGEITVDVNPIGGVVRLSGRATGADQVRELQRRALSVPGVKRVENEMSVPDSPAPGPFHAERQTDDAEPLPTELADRGEGRQPAPLGAGDDAPGRGSDGRGPGIP